MLFAFLDEAGYTSNWLRGLAQQPYYALSAVCIFADQLQPSYVDTREAISALNLPQLPGPLGQGFEIKAREIASGAGWWQHHNAERNVVRDTMLSAPSKQGGSAFVVAIDKDAHRKKYVSPQDPYMLSFQFLFERLAHYLNASNERAYIVYDQNTRLQHGFLRRAAALMKSGATVPFFSLFYGRYATFTLQMDRILEVSLGDSKYSLGLQYADYFATFAYCYLRDGRPSNCGWWQTLTDSLYRHQGKLDGVGLKVFP